MREINLLGEKKLALRWPYLLGVVIVCAGLLVVKVFWLNAVDAPVVIETRQQFYKFVGYFQQNRRKIALLASADDQIKPVSIGEILTDGGQVVELSAQHLFLRYPDHTMVITAE